jgi:hypothetical protein
MKISDEYKAQLKEMLICNGSAEMMRAMAELTMEAAKDYPDDAIIHTYLPYIKTCAAACHRAEMTRYQQAFAITRDK